MKTIAFMLMVQDVGKPVFMLKPADGAIGAHQQAAADYPGLLRRWGAR